MKVEIVKFDNKGRGIGYINDKIVFIPKTVPGDIVNMEVVLEKKKLIEGRLTEIISPSKLRTKAICPYFDVCGGCDLMNISLSEALEYKLTKVNDILTKSKIDYKVTEIIKSEPYNYRDKVSLKIADKKIGFYQNDTHRLVEIEYCYLCKEAINNIIIDLSLLNVTNGEVVIRANYNDDILLSISTSDNIENIYELVNKHKIVGILKNNECIFGEDYFIDKISNYLFKVSYNSFFQVNPFICSKLFDLIEEYTADSTNVLDLYCGVGTLSIVASKNASKVVGVEIVENAIIDANLNKKFNNKNNLEFICADTKNILDKITEEFDTIILDPPRSGVAKDVIDKINTIKPSRVIYVSCNPMTLARDLKLLEDNYNIETMKLLDMFPETEHVETVALLSRKINVHNMKLNSSPFEMIKSGQKTIELRLFDEKRQQVKVGDKIVFTNTTTGETLNITVMKLHLFDTFDELYQSLPLLQCGYTTENIDKATSSDMEQYYSVEEQEKYGVVGIELCRPQEITDESMTVLYKKISELS